ncbi:drug/metabolite transporter (DMT)-like permease [Tepidicella xavieri]|uniref:Drug/metabolite transporter (DMT)-like permease n=2 Tax=Tepidicella xavieri TaxID=360241 RepID=A0A4V6PWM9_9BURK|nr:drug/metabolite transporter (DMT)-like permease [Tepidicella xavieri]
MAKLLLEAIPPVLLGGLLYLGSGLGLLATRLWRDRGWQPSGLRPGEGKWLAAAIAFGGVLGPVALMFGLQHTGASTASLLLNLEAVLTAVLAWVVFKENADRRVVLGMLAIVAGGVLLSWPSANASQPGGGWGAGLIALACLCWAIDNNLTRNVSASDALFIAGSKGLVAGSVNITLAAMLGATWPGWSSALGAMAVGLLGYGISLALFVLALRGLGTARAGAYFSVAPFVGALVSLVWLGEQASTGFWAAGSLMALGIWLHLTERHAHEHTHEPLIHSHAHVHDEHHQHPHAFAWNGQEPHVHEHRHTVITHSHPHYPDIHHRHRH